jgi:ATP/maltotriose-dependent transcriptional regulator MalT
MLDESNDPIDADRTRISWILAFAHTYAGRLNMARSIAMAEYQKSVDSGTVSGALHTYQLGVIALATGKLPEAERWLTEASDRFYLPFYIGVIPMCWAAITQVRAYLGRHKDAAEALAQAEETLRFGDDAYTLAAPTVALARAWTVAARGDLSTAKRLARDAATLASERDQPTLEAIALHDALRLGSRTGIADRLEALTEAVEGPLCAAFAAHGRALAPAKADQLERVSMTFEHMDARLLAAEAAAEAAAVWRQAGLVARQKAASLRVSRLASECGRPRTPALDLADQVSPLTRREREVAVLAASGLTSPQIADRLFVSSRTVEGHLDKIFAKLGVTHRHELAGRDDLIQP